jgi:hypothetical protein
MSGLARKRLCRLMQLDLYSESISRFCYCAILATFVACSGVSGSCLRAQSPDPVKLQQIIADINAKAAAATWGDRQTQQTVSSPSAPSVNSPEPAQPSSSNSTAPSSTGSPNSSAIGFSSYASVGNDPGLLSSPNQPSSSSALAPGNTPAPADQPAQSDAVLPTTPSPSPATATIPTAVALTKPRRAEVTYTSGLISVRADDSSLNQILRQISQLTGLTITGGVAEERVFGSYPPSKPSIVIRSLLDGTGSSMILREDRRGTLTELILTPHSGSATPPGPNDSIFDTDADKDIRAQGVSQPVKPASTIGARTLTLTTTQPDPRTEVPLPVRPSVPQP